MDYLYVLDHVACRQVAIALFTQQHDTKAGTAKLFIGHTIKELTS